MADNRARAFNWVMYPESLPDDFLQIIDDLHVPCVLAYHDRDVWTESDERKNPDHKAGTLKKDHYHGMLTFDGKKSIKQVLGMLEPLGVSYVEVVHNVQSFTRYLLHLDDPGKAQYDKDCLICFNGISLDFSRTLTTSDVNAILRDICSFIRDNNITEFADIWFYAMDNEPDWFQVLSQSRAYVVNKVIASMRHKSSNPGL